MQDPESLPCPVENITLTYTVGGSTMGPFEIMAGVQNYTIMNVVAEGEYTITVAAQNVVGVGEPVVQTTG